MVKLRTPDKEKSLEVSPRHCLQGTPISRILPKHWPVKCEAWSNPRFARRAPRIVCLAFGLDSFQPFADDLVIWRL
jgi:hypothetical protein